MKASIAELEEKEKQIISDRDAALVPIGNIVHDSVPVSDNEVRQTLRGNWESLEFSGVCAVLLTWEQLQVQLLIMVNEAMVCCMHVCLLCCCVCGLFVRGRVRVCPTLQDSAQCSCAGPAQ
jgi:hypothetical protein